MHDSTRIGVSERKATRIVVKGMQGGQERFSMKQLADLECPPSDNLKSLI